MTRGIVYIRNPGQFNIKLKLMIKKFVPKEQNQKKSKLEKTATSHQEGPSTHSQKAGAKAKANGKGRKDQDSRGGSKGGAMRKGVERP